MHWADLLKLWTYQFEQDPLSKASKQQLTGAGTSQPDAIPDIRQDGSYWGGSGKGTIRLRDSNDFIDLSSVTNRTSRYKEYERLRNVPEIEMAMTVMADEACLAGNTRVATPFYGMKPIRWLTEHKANERFLVYCWDFDKNDYTLGWAFEPRLVKKAKTVKVKLDDGSNFVCTEDHRVLLRSGEWIEAGKLDWEDELMPFYRLDAAKHQKVNQFPRIFTFQHGWKHERNFIDEWRTGEISERQIESYQACNMIAEKISCRNASKLMSREWNTLEDWIHKNGFSLQELRTLGRKAKRRRILNVRKYKDLEVFDLSVEKYENFCGESVIFHNCQKGENKHVAVIEGVTDEIKSEVEKLLFNRNYMNLDRKLWGIAKNVFTFGDHFAEIVINPENPKEGVYKIMELPPDSMFRIETTKGKLVEFQQSNDGPDYQALQRVPVTQATEADLRQATAVRFSPNQVIHWKIGDDRKMFYPYGVSLVEPARGPAHQLRLMEDAMVVYRLCLVGNSRIMTPNGWKYIKDIKPNDTIYSYDRKQTIPVTVQWQENNGKKEVWKLRSQHIEIIGTPDHPILVNRKGKIQYVELQNLKPRKDKLINITRNDEIQVKIPKVIGEKWAKLDWSQKTAFRNNHYENITELMKICGLSENRVKQFLYAEGKSLPYEQAVKICNTFSLDENKLHILNKGEIHSERIQLPEYVDENFARLFGFLLGDGCIPNDKLGYRLAFAASPDKELNALYAGLLKKYFGKVGFAQDKRNPNPELGNYTVCSQVACRTFVEMGFIPGARNKRIPSWVFTAPKNIRKAFVEGISDADGCERYTKAGLWFSTIEICNKDLVADIKEIWHSIGLCSGKVSHRKRKGGHEIELGRKMPPTKSHFVTITSRELPQYENVWKVEKLDEQQEVYDIEVSGNEHNFVANCTPVHNSRAPERRVFYIDVSTLSPSRAETFMERIKDQFRKKKTATGRGQSGPNQVEERWHPPAIDEDYWLPIRPNSNTRIETLPGAQNLGEVDDALYFRNKLFTALNFPKNYFNNEDAQATRISLSAQDIKFARMIERLQAHIEDGLLQLVEIHFQLLGVPEQKYEDLSIKLTPPSDWRELSKQEITNNRINNANALKGSMLMPDYDVLTQIMRYTDDEAQEMIARMKIQKLEDFKLQVLAANPQLLGIGVPAAQGETEMGAEGGGPNPMLAPDGGMGGMPGGTGGMPGGGPPPGPGGMPGGEPTINMSQEGPPEPPPQGQQGQPQKQSGPALPKAEIEDIKKYDLEIQNYAKEQDIEDIDYSEVQ